MSDRLVQVVLVELLGRQGLQDVRGHRVDPLGGLDVVLLGDLRRRMPEHLGREVGTTGPADSAGNGLSGVRVVSIGQKALRSVSFFFSATSAAGLDEAVACTNRVCPSQSRKRASTLPSPRGMNAISQ